MNGEKLKREIRDAYYNDDMYSRYDLVDAVEDIVAENAKLRELVEVGLRCCDHKCDGCKFLRYGLCHVDEFEDEARDLGVEVTS